MYSHFFFYPIITISSKGNSTKYRHRSNELCPVIFAKIHKYLTVVNTELYYLTLSLKASNLHDYISSIRMTKISPAYKV